MVLVLLGFGGLLVIMLVLCVGMSVGALLVREIHMPPTGDHVAKWVSDILDQRADQQKLYADHSIENEIHAWKLACGSIRKAYRQKVDYLESAQRVLLISAALAGLISLYKII